MQTVNFIRMKDGTAEEYQLLDRCEREYVAGTADRVLALLKGLQGSMAGYRIDRLGHSLQTATRAQRDGASDEMVVAALLHDIGDGLAPQNHGDFAASILKPYVSAETHWIIKHHGVFQGYYFFHHLGADRNLRDRYRDHPCFDACVDFCERWIKILSIRITIRCRYPTSNRWCVNCSRANRFTGIAKIPMRGSQGEIP